MRIEEICCGSYTAKINLNRGANCHLHGMIHQSEFKVSYKDESRI